MWFRSQERSNQAGEGESALAVRREASLMKTPKRVGVCIVVGLALSAGLVTSVAAHPGGLAATTGSATFSDPAGDSGAAPDITSVTINGDPATGTITVTVTATGYLPASPDGMGREIDVFLDTDNNASTGSSSGSEYALGALNDSTGRYWDVARWDGSAWQSMPQSATMSFTRAGDALAWTLNATDLGGATGFSFYVASSTYAAADNAVAHDFAPENGRWTYDLSAGAPSTTTTTSTTTSAPARSLTMFLTPVIGKPAAVPARPAAGKRLTLSFRVTRSDDDKPLASGKVTSAVSVAGKLVPHTQSFTRGVARLSLLVPSTAKGKRLTVKLTIKAPSYQGQDGAYVDVATGQTGTIHTRYEGLSATRIVSLPIR
jgi:hypothetical protein